MVFVRIRAGASMSHGLPAIVLSGVVSCQIFWFSLNISISLQSPVMPTTIAIGVCVLTTPINLANVTLTSFSIGRATSIPLAVVRSTPPPSYDWLVTAFYRTNCHKTPVSTCIFTRLEWGGR